MSLPHHTCWASADDWRPGFVMLGANVDTIPIPPPPSPVIIGVDGFWGAHEWTVYPQPHHPQFPYLAWIPLRQSNPSVPSDILTRSVDKSMWRAHPDNSNVRVIEPTFLDELKREWTSIKVAAQDAFKTITSDLSFSSVRHPDEVYIRVVAALTRLEKGFEAWRDFVEVFRNLQRSLLELVAFLDWWKDIHAGNNFRSPIRGPTRGAIFKDARLYEKYARWSVRAFLLVHKSHFVLDPAKEVGLSPRTLCKVQLMSLQPLSHSLDHWYYPPLVQDIVMDLETAARGYAKRLDVFNPTKMFKRKREKMENKKNDEAGRSAKRAKTSTAPLIAQPTKNEELRRLTDAGAAPGWFPGIQGVWTQAMNHVSHLDLASRESPRRFVLPPVHLFWGGEPQNQRIYYYHYLLLFHEIKSRSERDLPALTTQEWRFILGNTYWKKQWPKHDESNPPTFDPNVFWKYGGPLLFGDERSADVAAGRYDPRNLLSCRCDVQLTTADDIDIRQVVAYYLNSFHVYEEIKEMERLQFPTTFEKRWKDQVFVLDQIVEMWDPSGTPPNPDFFCNKKVWRSWVRAVRDLVADWDGFEQWDWNPFSGARNMGINKLSGPEFQKFTVRLLAFFIHSFVRRLGYYPSPLLRPPTHAGHSCANHQRKFGNGLYHLPLRVE